MQDNNLIRETVYFYNSKGTRLCGVMTYARPQYDTKPPIKKEDLKGLEKKIAQSGEE